MGVYSHIYYSTIVRRIMKGTRLAFPAIAACVLCLSLAQREVHADFITTSDVQITRNIFGFTGFLDWLIIDGKLKPTLHGVLSGEDARGLCARMRLDFYGEGQVWLATKQGGEMCPKGDRAHEWTVNLHSYESNKLNEVKVSIEKKTAGKDWANIGSKVKKLGPLHTELLIKENGFDFGGQAFDEGAPKKPGDVEWTRSGGKVTPRVTGTLHITNAASACARLQIEYFSYLTKELLATKTGGKLCASDNQRWWRKVDLSKYSDPTIGFIDISLQTLRADGSWRVIGQARNLYIIEEHGHTGVSLVGGGGF